MNRLPRVLIDCDGPLADFVTGLCRALRHRGSTITPEEIVHHDLSLSLNLEEVREIDTIMRTPGFWTCLPRMPYAEELVARARLMGAEVVCVTHPYPSPRFFTERAAWLADLRFPADDVLFVRAKRKPFVAGDILIEDHPGTAAAWCDANPTGIAILVERPWNTVHAAEWVAHRNMYRVGDAYLFDTVERFLVA